MRQGKFMVFETAVVKNGKRAKIGDMAKTTAWDNEYTGTGTPPMREYIGRISAISRLAKYRTKLHVELDDETGDYLVGANADQIELIEEGNGK
jgi:hypothetical protein